MVVLGRTGTIFPSTMEPTARETGEYLWKIESSIDQAKLLPFHRKILSSGYIIGISKLFAWYIANSNVSLKIIYNRNVLFIICIFMVYIKQ